MTIKGTASDNVGVTRVQYRIGSGPLKSATGTTAWTFKTKLKKGANSITIIVADAAGNSVSRTVKIRRK
ncbi:MAG: hypothetical protein HC845_13440 [Akkermansiaceae bacterium]|nr:hypothetical protein [Akkermansiaceae bacterium]